MDVRANVEGVATVSDFLTVGFFPHDKGKAHGHHTSDRDGYPLSRRLAFNLPGLPYFLLCAETAREGIDLHLWRQRVLEHNLD